MSSKDFFSQPTLPKSPGETAYQQVCEALEDWSSRVYAQNTPWTATNEARRARRVATLTSLKEFWESHHRYSPSQLALIDRVATTE